VYRYPLVQHGAADVTGLVTIVRRLAIARTISEVMQITTGTRRRLASTKRQYACAVVAKPDGTFTPRLARCRTISPSDAFLPPTWGTSICPSVSNQATTVDLSTGRHRAWLIAMALIRSDARLLFPNRVGRMEKRGIASYLLASLVSPVRGEVRLSKDLPPESADAVRPAVGNSRRHYRGHPCAGCPRSF
jgi:hypothetical protein